MMIIIIIIIIVIIIIIIISYLIKYHDVNTYGERRYYSTHSEPRNCKMIG